MATTNKLIRGRVGNVVFYRVGNVTYVRGVPLEYRDANSPEQRENRVRLMASVRFYQQLKETLLREIWRVAAQGIAASGYTLFLKVNIKVFNANGKIGDFSRLQLVVGKMQEVNHLEATKDDDDRVTLAWEDNSGSPSARKDDRLMVVVLYGNRSFTPTFIEDLKATRQEGTATFSLKRKPHTAVHLYCFFAAKDGSAYSSNQYIKL